MDSRVTMALAGVLLLGAVFAGYWGIKLSQAPEPVPTQAHGAPVAAPAVERLTQAADDVQRTPVVVALRDLPPFVALSAADLAIEQVRTAPPGSFSSVEQVVGRQLWAPLPAGGWLNQAGFEAGGPLSRMIRPDERAVAVAVDEVIGVGGHLSPGDYVDVLLVMQDEAGARERSAQVAVPALRLLSLGEELGPTRSGQPATAARDKDEDKARRAPRNVVLAVPQQWLTRLMLASQAGTLRLAVRSADEKLQARYQDGESAPIKLDEQTRNLLPLAQLSGRAAPAARPVPRATGGAPRVPAVEVLRGGQSTWQTP
jgi:pilus assembly protein CpaB